MPFSMTIEMKLLLLLSFISLSAALLHEFVEEWHLWKNQHKKGYRSQMEELERHAIWLSNKKYIEEHNIHSDVFGYTLAMNHLGDLVSKWRLLNCVSCNTALYAIRVQTNTMSYTYQTNRDILPNNNRMCSELLKKQNMLIL